jgi:hypothetical protein
MMNGLNHCFRYYVLMALYEGRYALILYLLVVMIIFYFNFINIKIMHLYLFL